MCNVLNDRLNLFKVNNTDTKALPIEVVLVPIFLLETHAG